MSIIAKVGDQVIHNHHGLGVLVEHFSGGAVKVKFGSKLMMVFDTSLKSLGELTRLLDSGRFEEADCLYANSYKEMLPQHDYDALKVTARFAYDFVEVYQQGALADLDVLYNQCPVSIDLPVDDFITLKLPKLRSELSKIGVALDEEQVRANACPENQLLIKARAGSGKTRTLCARAALAIKDESLSPNQVMILAFNKAAASEVKQRVQKLAGIPDFDNARTFHSLAYQLVKPKKKLLFDKGGEPSAREQSRFVQRLMQRILNPAFKEAMVEFFRKELEQIENIGRDLSPDEYLKFRRAMELITLDGKRVKSNGEKFIADFLFEHGIEYQYERAWAWNSGLSDDIAYRPDFSIVADGQDYILEHWALDPEDWSATLPEYWEKSADQYRMQILDKREFWLEKEKPLLETHVGLICDGREKFEIRLKKILESNGICCRKLSKEEIVARVFQNDFAISRVAELFLQFIQRAKKRSWSADDAAKHISDAPNSEPKVQLFHKLALRAFREYELCLEEQQAMDFDDLLVQATEEVKAQGALASIHLGQGLMMPLGQLKWILIDEYQDFSELYYKMLDAILQANTEIRLVAVGDDWQAINAFAGADLRFLNQFSKYFHGAGTVEVTTNYRSDRWIVAAGNRLMEGYGSHARISREDLGRIETKFIDDVWVEFRNDDRFKQDRESDVIYLPSIAEEINLSEANLRQARSLKLCAQIIREDPAKKTLLLARTVKVYGLDLESFRARLINILSKLLEIRSEILEKNIMIMTAHRSKGQEAHRVIILDATQRKFPKIHPDNLLFGLFGTTLTSVLEEERRLFYVAMTRAEHRLHILTEKQNESLYLDEIKNQLYGEGAEDRSSLTQPLGDFAAGIKDKIEGLGMLTEEVSAKRVSAGNEWDSVRVNVCPRLLAVVSALEEAGVPVPRIKYCLPSEDDILAELAWPDVSQPVAILTDGQMPYFDRWISLGWKVPGPDLPIEKIIKGVCCYVFGKAPVPSSSDGA